MAKLNSQDRLKETIQVLELKRADDARMLKEQFHDTVESLKPINLIKSTFKEISRSPQVTGNLVSTSVGLSVGFLSKLLFVGFSKNPIKRLIGNALMFGITNFVARHPNAVRNVGNNVVKMISRKKRNGVYHPENP
jgi:hypothetical protein